jgi:hypothetical protein
LPACLGADIRTPPDCDRARSSAGEHYLDMVGVTGSIPVVPTIQSSRTAQTVVDRKEAVSAGILSPIFNIPGLCQQFGSIGWILGLPSLHPKIPFLAPEFQDGN